MRFATLHLHKVGTGLSPVAVEHARRNRDRGDDHSSAPPTPPYKRVRIRRLRKIKPLRAGESIRLSPQELRRSAGFRFGFTVF